MLNNRLLIFWVVGVRSCAGAGYRYWIYFPAAGGTTAAVARRPAANARQITMNGTSISTAGYEKRTAGCIYYCSPTNPCFSL